MLQRRAHGQIAGRADAGDADLFPFEVGTFSDGRIGEQGKDHLVRGRADPDKVGALSPSRHHRRRRQMAKLDFTGEKRLHRGGAAANVDQIGIEAMLSKMSVFVGQPERADAGRQRAVGGANWGGTILRCSRGRDSAGKQRDE